MTPCASANADRNNQISCEAVATITVSNLPGVITKVTIDLLNLSHGFPGDVDMLLVGPGGQKFIIMSDVIGDANWVNNNITLDDAAPTNLPAAPGAVASGSYKPTDYTAGDTFPGPAPAGPYQSPAAIGGAALASVFNGTNPNDVWSLYGALWITEFGTQKISR